MHTEICTHAHLPNAYFICIGKGMANTNTFGTIHAHHIDKMYNDIAIYGCHDLDFVALPTKVVC